MSVRILTRCLCSFFLVVPQGTFSNCTPWGISDNGAFLSDFEKEVVRELNLARQRPKYYASVVEKLKPYYVGNLVKRPGEPIVLTMEGVSAVEEAIRFLRSVEPLPPLESSRGMSLGARDHVKDQGKQGTIRHQGSDGSQPWDRVNRYGTWRGIVGENISYGRDNARDVVIGLIVDDGVPGRGHRDNIFNPEFGIVGVACGYHSVFDTMCVITFAERYAEARL